jgi:F-type H+-transporting ATPase subunit delta
VLRESIARRYARALFDSVPEAERKALSDDLVRFAEAADKVPELRQVLVNPNFTEAERKSALDAAAKSLRIGDGVRRLVDLLVQNRRAESVGAIATAFRRLSDQQHGIVRARVIGAHPVPESAVDQIAQSLGKVLGKRVEVDTTTDPSLLGGLQVRIGSVLVDGSVRARIEDLREKLLHQA